MPGPNIGSWQYKFQIYLSWDSSFSWKLLVIHLTTNILCTQILMSVILMMEGVNMCAPTLMEAITVLVMMDINFLMTLSIVLVCNYMFNYN